MICFIDVKLSIKFINNLVIKTKYSLLFSNALTDDIKIMESHTVVDNVISTDNVTKVCRSCLSEKTNLVKFMEDDDVNMYETCTSVKLREVDMAIYLCADCVNQVRSFMVFRNTCIKSHQIVKSLVEKQESLVVVTVTDNTDTLEASNKNIEIIEEEEKDEAKTELKILFSDEKLLSEHKKGCHKRNDLRYYCDKCDKSYTSKYNLEIHMYKHRGIRPYTCRLCERQFIKPSALTAHLHRHNSDKNYLCGFCGRGFPTVELLENHNKGHLAQAGEKIFKCSKCPKHFSLKSILAVHERTHTGDKPYLCSTCGKSFGTVSNLYIHRRIHTGEKPYSCRFCGQCFSQSGVVTAHERIHTGERPFECTYCRKTFNQGSSLRTHIRRKHSGQKHDQECE